MIKHNNSSKIDTIINTQFNEFICPNCKNQLIRNDLKLKCKQCNFLGEIDENGIILLSKNKNLYFANITKSNYIQILTSKGNILDNFEMLISNPELNQSIKLIQKYGLNMSRGAGIVFTNISKDSIILDFGLSWENLSNMISSFCKQVVCMNVSYENLLFQKRINSMNNITYVQGGSEKFLPFMNNTFDLVIFNGVFEITPQFITEGNPFKLQKRFLQELYRILKPNGQIYMGVNNKIGLSRLIGKKEVNTGFHHLATSPELILNKNSSKSRVKQNKKFLHSYFSYHSLLKKIGFKFNIIYPYPNFMEYNQILTADHIENISIIKTRWKIVSKVLQKLRILKYFMNSYCIIASKKDNFEEGLKTIINEDITDIRKIIISTTNNIRITTKKRFYKIPLTPNAAGLLKREIKNLNILVKDNQLKKYLPQNYLVNRYGDYPVLSMDLVDLLYDPIDAPVNEILDFSEKLFKILRSSNNEEIAIKDIYKFPKTHQFCLLRNKNELLRSILTKDFWNFRFVPNRSHGEYHHFHVLYGKKGFKVIDWDKFSRNQLLELDKIHLVIMYFIDFDNISMENATQKYLLKCQKLRKNLTKNQPRFASMLEEIQQLDYNVKKLYCLDKIEKILLSVQHPAYLHESWKSQAINLLESLVKYEPTKRVK